MHTPLQHAACRILRHRGRGRCVIAAREGNPSGAWWLRKFKVRPTIPEAQPHKPSPSRLRPVLVCARSRHKGSQTLRRPTPQWCHLITRPDRVNAGLNRLPEASAAGRTRPAACRTAPKRPVLPATKGHAYACGHPPLPRRGRERSPACLERHAGRTRSPRRRSAPRSSWMPTSTRHTCWWRSRRARSPASCCCCGARCRSRASIWSRSAPDHRVCRQAGGPTSRPRHGAVRGRGAGRRRAHPRHRAPAAELFRSRRR